MKVPDTKENAVNCICPNCPTHNACMKSPMTLLYCARGKTRCSFERQGCLCGECPVASDYRLRDLYFCDIGAAT